MPVQGAAPGPDVDAAVGAVTAAARQAIEDLVAQLTAQNADLTQQITDLTSQAADAKTAHAAELQRLEDLVQQLQAAIDADQANPA